jgi:hypothetical protein
MSKPIPLFDNCDYLFKDNGPNTLRRALGNPAEIVEDRALNGVALKTGHEIPGA